MTDKKISELDAITGSNTAATDVFVVVDTSTGQTKKITREELNNAIEQDVLDSIDIDTINGDFTVNGNINLGDNNKAIFGAGSDLQIFHQSSNGNSIIKEQGGGILSLQTNGSEISLYDTANAANMARFITGGAVQLSHNGSTKLSTNAGGINVTGTVTADGLTVDGNATIQNTGNSYRTISLDANRTAAVNTLGRLNYKWDGNEVVRLQATSGSDTTNKDNGSFTIFTSDDGTLDQRLKIDSNGDVSFYEDTGTTAKMVWKSADERLGLGTSSPRDLLNLSSSTGSHIVLENSTSSLAQNAELGGIEFYTNDTSNAGVGVAASIRSKVSGTTGGQAMLIFSTADSVTNDVERMRITSAGNVGIGTDSPTLIAANGKVLQVTGTTTARSGQLRLSTSDNSQEAGFYVADGNVQFGAITNHPVLFRTNNTERMRLDSSGNLLLGTTNADVANSASVEGISIRGGSNFLGIARSGASVAKFNRQSNDGAIVAFGKDGTTVGTILNVANRLAINSEDTTGYLYVDDSPKFRWRTNDFIPHDNGTKDLGHSSTRFKDLYLGGGVYLGGTGAANKLDDYEEGTFTPVLRDNTSGGNTATGTVINGVYTKIGRLVHVDIYFVNIDTSGMVSGNAAYITNLPFASLSGDNFSTGFPRIDQVTVDGVGIAAEVAQGNTYIRLKQIISGAADENVIVGDFVSGYADLFLGLTYTTNT